MKKFLGKLAILGLLILSSIGIWCYVQRNDILVMTNSVSLDTRLYEMKNTGDRQYDIVGIGSSMMLYQLDGKTFMDSINSEKTYYNFGAWGLSLADDEKLLPYIVEGYQPKEVIMFGNIIDFSPNYGSSLNMKEIGYYLDDNMFNDFNNILNYGFPFNRETKENYMIDRFNPTEKNEDLRYDQWGGVLLDVYGEDILDVRYNAVYEDEPAETQYNSMKDIATYLQARGIAFYYVQTPSREHFIGDSEKIFENYYNRCQNIVESNGGHYSNFSNTTNYTDKYFADAIHLNREGALKLSREFCEWYIEQ